MDARGLQEFFRDRHLMLPEKTQKVLYLHAAIPASRKVVSLQMPPLDPANDRSRIDPAVFGDLTCCEHLSFQHSIT
ncbi:MAG: hypothetical protein A3F84_05540 [Candidatus Handelsmanbacteria bacterium RIFCSPLOWO2_12_FULL_64_10]|uniref:Uncharacterized protein n=1 Tax=Handelsmanbacteria sp. (strain RIFCSPLOWO2_12_FULL_64_10) TaxID=1817868 RepID=A0A1F6C668_HANXR|nr:MAG: hypothetical protein A3F84_05540 [Candidatus Handelsmanbacteria bacterium RIFCSPLOWO2_12_FULL_64_10]